MTYMNNRFHHQDLALPVFEIGEGSLDGSMQILLVWKYFWWQYRKLVYVLVRIRWKVARWWIGGVVSDGVTPCLLLFCVILKRSCLLGGKILFSLFFFTEEKQMDHKKGSLNRLYRFRVPLKPIYGDSIDGRFTRRVKTALFIAPFFPTHSRYRTQ